MRQLLTLICALVATTLVHTGPAAAQSVRTYASQVNDVDAVNSHWIIGEDGVVLIDAQRILPEAKRALAHLRRTTDLPVVAIFVTHAHTDHYGGLPVWLQAFPDAKLYLDRTTRDAIATDAQGFNAARKRRHGERFASQSALDEAISDAIILDNDDEIQLEGMTFHIHTYEPSEAPSTMLVALPEESILFVGDLINVGVPAVPFESALSWIEQLDRIEEDFPGFAVYQGHGPAPVELGEIANQRHFLKRLISLVQKNLDDGVMSADERDDVVFELEAEWPFLSGVAGNTRQEILAFNVDLVTRQLSTAMTASRDKE